MNDYEFIGRLLKDPMVEKAKVKFAYNEKTKKYSAYISDKAGELINIDAENWGDLLLELDGLCQDYVEDWEKERDEFDFQSFLEGCE